MTTAAAPSHDVLATMAANITQLTEPIYTAARRRITQHPCLLDQLRDAAIPGTVPRGPERRRIPTSRPPLRLDAVDTLSEICVGITGWHAKLGLPSPPRHADWFKAVLRMLPDAAQSLAPSIADWLAADVEAWWHDAAIASGWRPDDLRRLR